MPDSKFGVKTTDRPKLSANDFHRQRELVSFTKLATIHFPWNEKYFTFKKKKKNLQQWYAHHFLVSKVSFTKMLPTIGTAIISV